MKHCKTLAKLWQDTARKWLLKEFGSVEERDRNIVISKIYGYCADALEESLRLDSENDNENHN